jgi:recombinational DNA repair protein RecR
MFKKKRDVSTIVKSLQKMVNELETCKCCNETEAEDCTTKMLKLDEDRKERLNEAARADAVAKKLTELLSI